MSDKAEINRYRNALTDCVGSKAHLEAEIERLRAQMREESSRVWKLQDAERERAEAAEAKLARVVEALEHYGRHDEDCTNIPADAGRPMQHCDCGLEAALAAAKASE